MVPEGVFHIRGMGLVRSLLLGFKAPNGDVHRRFSQGTPSASTPSSAQLDGSGPWPFWTLGKNWEQQSVTALALAREDWKAPFLMAFFNYFHGHFQQQTVSLPGRVKIVILWDGCEIPHLGWLKPKQNHGMFTMINHLSTGFPRAFHPMFHVFSLVSRPRSWCSPGNPIPAVKNVVFLESWLKATTRIHTVDGRNPAPVGRWFIPLFIGFQQSKVVQDFFHPP